MESIIELINYLSDEDLFEDGKRNWAKTNGKEFSVCRLVHLNTIIAIKRLVKMLLLWYYVYR